MSLLTLSPELLEEIALYLRARDISSLALSSRRFHDIVCGSLLLQYAHRTELAGVHDPLQDLSRRSIVDRMASLRRWEASWKDLARYLSSSAAAASPPPRLVIPAERDLQYSARSSSAMIICLRSTGRAIRRVCVSLRSYYTSICAMRSVRAKHHWRKIGYPKDSIAITQAFSIEEDDLVVSVLR